MLYFEALNKLDKRDRDLITAHELEVHTYVELAAKTGEKDDTVRARGAGALKKLEQIIDELLDKREDLNGLSGAFIMLQRDSRAPCTSIAWKSVIFFVGIRF